MYMETVMANRTEQDVMNSRTARLKLMTQKTAGFYEGEGGEVIRDYAVLIGLIVASFAAVAFWFGPSLQSICEQVIRMLSGT